MHNELFYYIGLLLLVCFLVMLAQRIKISYPIIIVVGGLIISFIPGHPSLEIDPELIFLIFLPPLLYEAAWETSWKDFWKWRRIIGSFAFLIVLVTSLVIALVSSSLIPGFTLALGFLLGGIISPPDAVSATSVLKNIDVPKRISAIIEGESLLNDASSIIVFRFALVAIQTGTFVFSEAATSFFLVIVMGILIGLGVAFVIYALHRWLPTTASMDTVLTLVTPYCMYIIAEHFHFSGVLAVVSGGLFLSGRKHSMLSNRSRIRGVNFWPVFSFVLNGFVFLLIGLQLKTVITQVGSDNLKLAVIYSLVITGTLIITRLVCALGASGFTTIASRFIKTADSNPGWKGPLIFGWAGMRGVVSLAAALSIPRFLGENEPFPYRNLILFITFAVILITLVFQGLTLPWLIRKLNLEDPDYPVSASEQDIRVRKKLVAASLKLLEEKYQQELQTNELLQNLKKSYENDLLMLEHVGRSRAGEHQHNDPVVTFKEILMQIIEEQRKLLMKINRKAEVDEAVIKKFQLLLDIEEEKLRHQLSIE